MTHTHARSRTCMHASTRDDTFPEQEPPTTPRIRGFVTSTALRCGRVFHAENMLACSLAWVLEKTSASWENLWASSTILACIAPSPTHDIASTPGFILFLSPRSPSSHQAHSQPRRRASTHHNLKSVRKRCLLFPIVHKKPLFKKLPRTWPTRPK